MMRSAPRAGVWFWATILAAAVPLLVFGAWLRLGAVVPAVEHAAALCTHLGRMAGGLLVDVLGAGLIAYPIARTAVSVVRRVTATQRWLRLLDMAVTPPCGSAHLDQVRRSELADRIHFVECALPGAWTVGLWRPHIVVTSGMLEALSPDEFHAVLLHERCHLQSRDPLKALVVGALSDGFRWVPAVAVSASRYSVLREMAADMAAVREVGERVVQAALTKCEQAGAHVTPAAGLAPAFTDVGELRLRYLREGTVAIDPRGAASAWFQTWAVTLVALGFGMATCGAVLQ